MLLSGQVLRQTGSEVTSSQNQYVFMTFSLHLLNPTSGGILLTPGSKEGGAIESISTSFVHSRLRPRDGAHHVGPVKVYGAEKFHSC